VLFTKDIVAEMLVLPQAKHLKLLAKQKEPNFQKIAPPKILVDREGWKMSMFKGMYIARMPTLIQGIWLQGNRLAYVAKKLMIMVALVKTRMQINWANVIFNNLHSRLRDLSGPHETNTTTVAEFERAQILDRVLRKWFLMDLSFQLLESKEEDELEENLLRGGICQ